MKVIMLLLAMPLAIGAIGTPGGTVSPASTSNSTGRGPSLSPSRTTVEPGEPEVADGEGCKNADSTGFFEGTVASVPPKIPPLATTCRYESADVRACLGLWIA